MLVALLGTAVLYAIGWLVTGRRRDGLVPAAIVGGVLGLVLRQFGVLPGSIEAWQGVAYHLFGISFLAIGLTRSEAVSIGGIWESAGFTDAVSLGTGSRWRSSRRWRGPVGAWVGTGLLSRRMDRASSPG